MWKSVQFYPDIWCVTRIVSYGENFSFPNEGLKLKTPVMLIGLYYFVIFSFLVAIIL